MAIARKKGSAKSLARGRKVKKAVGKIGRRIRKTALQMAKDAGVKDPKSLRALGKVAGFFIVGAGGKLAKEIASVKGQKGKAIKVSKIRRGTKLKRGRRRK